jgi:hypothetical protein
MSDRFYITTPLYYVNDRPHIGTSYTTVLADVFARYHRLMGEETTFLTGTDEHGQKVLQAATERKMEPQAHVDDVVKQFHEAWAALESSHDIFMRTTEPTHIEIVREILQELFDRDEIYRGEYEGCRREEPRRQSGGENRRGELLLPHVEVPGLAHSAHRGQSLVHPAGTSAERNAGLSAEAARRSVHFAAEVAAAVGHLAALR